MGRPVARTEEMEELWLGSVRLGGCGRLVAGGSTYASREDASRFRTTTVAMVLGAKVVVRRDANDPREDWLAIGVG